MSHDYELRQKAKKKRAYSDALLTLNLMRRAAGIEPLNKIPKGITDDPYRHPIVIALEPIGVTSLLNNYHLVFGKKYSLGYVERLYRIVFQNEDLGSSMIPTMRTYPISTTDSSTIDLASWSCPEGLIDFKILFSIGEFPECIDRRMKPKEYPTAYVHPFELWIGRLPAWLLILLLLVAMLGSVYLAHGVLTFLGIQM